MKTGFVLASLLVFQLNFGWAQEVTLNDLIYFQTIKNSLKIDRVLLTKGSWDCNCYRDFANLEAIREWIYDIPDSSKENIDKDYIRFDEVGHGFSSVITFYTTDKSKAVSILTEMKKAKLSEEKLQIFSNDSISARVSFFVQDNVAIQTVVGENRVKGTGKYAFILMDKVDYLKGLMIK